jgi:hypothetical protein
MKQFKVNFKTDGCFYINADRFILNEDTIIFLNDEGVPLKELFIPVGDVLIEDIPENKQIEWQIEKKC